MIKILIPVYAEGIKNLYKGRTLIIIVLLKVLFMFAILKVFFFPNFLKTNFGTDTQRSKHVIECITSK